MYEFLKCSYFLAGSLEDLRKCAAENKNAALNFLPQDASTPKSPDHKTSTSSIASLETQPSALTKVHNNGQQISKTSSTDLVEDIGLQANSDEMLSSNVQDVAILEVDSEAGNKIQDALDLSQQADEIHKSSTNIDNVTVSKA